MGMGMAMQHMGAPSCMRSWQPHALVRARTPTAGTGMGHGEVGAEACPGHFWGEAPQQRRAPSSLALPGSGGR